MQFHSRRSARSDLRASDRSRFAGINSPILPPSRPFSSPSRTSRIVGSVLVRLPAFALACVLVALSSYALRLLFGF